MAWLLATALVVPGLVWSYWPTLVDLVELWSYRAEYSHGWLVPLFAVALLWMRRDLIPKVSSGPCWGGLWLLLAGAALRLAGGYFWLPYLDPFSLLPTLAGLCVLLGGWPALRWAWPSVGFLTFMLPLPFFLQTGLANPLRLVATMASTFCLQTMGFPAFRIGNTIHGLSDPPLGVAEACNGLSMLVTFVALSVAVAIVIREGWLARVVILVSAVPIAIIANVLRIIVTAILYQTTNAEVAKRFFHDWAGYLMPLPALAMMWLELWILRHLFTDVGPEQEAMPILLGPSPSGAPAAGPPPRRRIVPTKKPASPPGSVKPEASPVQH
jgi:exosortase